MERKTEAISAQAARLLCARLLSALSWSIQDFFKGSLQLDTVTSLLCPYRLKQIRSWSLCHLPDMAGLRAALRISSVFMPDCTPVALPVLLVRNKRWLKAHIYCLQFSVPVSTAAGGWLTEESFSPCTRRAVPRFHSSTLALVPFSQFLSWSPLHWCRLSK